MEILNHTLCETGNEDGRSPGFLKRWNILSRSVIEASLQA